MCGNSYKKFFYTRNPAPFYLEWMKLKWNQSQLPNYYGQDCRMQKSHSSFHFFLSGFSFVDTDNSHESREKDGTIFILCYHVCPLPNILTFICSFASEMITFLFSIAAHTARIFLLDNITQLLEISTWLHVIFIVLADFNLMFAVSRKQKQFQITWIPYTSVNLNIFSLQGTNIFHYVEVYSLLSVPIIRAYWLLKMTFVSSVHLHHWHFLG